MSPEARDPFAFARQGEVPPTGDRPAVPDNDADPLVALTAEEYRLRELGCDYREQADLIRFAISDRRERFRGIEEEDLPDPMGPLYRKAQEYEDAAGEAWDRIKQT